MNGVARGCKGDGDGVGDGEGRWCICDWVLLGWGGDVGDVVVIVLMMVLALMVLVGDGDVVGEGVVVIGDQALSPCRSNNAIHRVGGLNCRPVFTGVAWGGPRGRGGGGVG